MEKCPNKSRFYRELILQKMPARAGIFYLLMVISLFAQSTDSLKYFRSVWTISGSAQFVRESYDDAFPVNTYTYYTGIQYEKNQWALSFSLPLTVQNSWNAVVQNNDTLFNRNNISGTGDIFLYARREITLNAISGLYFTPAVEFKLPSGKTDIGSGRLDVGFYGNLTKYWPGYFVTASVGRLIFGSKDSQSAASVTVVGLGAGKTIIPNRLLSVLYSETYINLYAGLPSPSVLNAGVSYSLWGNFRLQMIAQKGITSTSPDVGFQVGLVWALEKSGFHLIRGKAWN